MKYLILYILCALLAIYGLFCALYLFAKCCCEDEDDYERYLRRKYIEYKQKNQRKEEPK